MANNLILNQILLHLLQLSFLLVPLYVNKNVLRFRINQQASLFFFILLILFFFILKTLFNSQKITTLSPLRVETHHKVLFAFFTFMVFSFLTSIYKYISFQDLLLFTSYLLIYFLVIILAKEERQLFTIIYTTLLASLLVALYTLLQYYNLDPFTPELNVLTSTIGQRNWIADYLFISLPIAFIFFLKELNYRKKLFYYLYLSLIFLNFIILQSRAIWIVVAVSALLGMVLIIKTESGILFLKNKNWLFLLVITFLLISTIFSTSNSYNRSPSFIEERVLPVLKGKEFSVNQRLLYYYVGYQMFKEQPLFGIGIGNFKQEYLYYQAKVLPQLPAKFAAYYANANEAHNEYLQILIEMGIIGLLLSLAVIWFFYRRVLRCLFHVKATVEKKAVLIGLLLGVSGFLVHCLFDFPLHVPTLGMTFAGMAGLAIAFCNNLERARDAVVKNNDENDMENGDEVLKSNKRRLGREAKIVLFLLLFLAFSYFGKILVFDPYRSELSYFKGLRYTVDQNYNMALKNFEQSYRLNPRNGENLLALGGTYYNLGQYDKAEYVLNQAKHYITDTGIFYNLALVYEAANRTQEAIESLNLYYYLSP